MRFFFLQKIELYLCRKESRLLPDVLSYNNHSYEARTFLVHN